MTHGDGSTTALTVRTGTVVVACGAIESSALLLRSGDRRAGRRQASAGASRGGGHGDQSGADRGLGSARSSPLCQTSSANAMYSRILSGTAGLAPTAFAATEIAAGAQHSRTLHVSAQLRVTVSPPPVCRAGICTIRNRGYGQMSTSVGLLSRPQSAPTATQPPCGTSFAMGHRIVRTVHTGQGNLVLHEAGLRCPEPRIGPRVDAVWAADGTDSTGLFAGARGHGSDIAYPMQDTAAPHGTITLARKASKRRRPGRSRSR